MKLTDDARAGHAGEMNQDVALAPSVPGVTLLAPWTDADPQVLERSALVKLAELDPQGRLGLIERVMRTFLDSMRGARATLEEAAARQDAEAAGMAAHTLKSASACVGASRLSACCAEIERAARDGRAEDWLAQQRSLLTEAGRVEAELERCLG